MCCALTGNILIIFERIGKLFPNNLLPFELMRSVVLILSEGERQVDAALVCDKAEHHKSDAVVFLHIRAR